MFRTLAALLVLAAVATTANAQPRGLPLSPGVHPGSSIGPGTQFLPQPTPRFQSGVRGMKGGFGQPFAPHSTFFPGYYPYFGYGYGGYGFGYGGAPSVVVEVVQPSPVLPPEPPQRRVILANEFPATLTVQFPAAADVWLNGEPVKGEASEERVLTSPVLKPGASFAFDVRARWERGGKTYEAKRAVTLESGARSRLIVVSGTEVK